MRGETYEGHVSSQGRQHMAAQHALHPHAATVRSTGDIRCTKELL